MSSRTFLVLVSAMLVMLALLYSGLDKKQNIDEELLLPGLSVVVNEIDEVKLTGAGRKPIATLQKTDTGWTVQERFGYPADIAKIRQTMLNLAKSRIVEEKTSSPALYARLGVDDIDAEDAGGVELTIRAPTETTTLIVGETGVQGANAYVRRAGEARSWMINANLELGRDTNDWLAREFLDIEGNSVQAVSIAHPDRSKLRIEKTGPDDQSFTVSDVPDGRELTYAGVANGIGSVLAALSFDDVMPVTEVSLDGIEPTATQFECFDGLIVNALIYETGDTIWAAFAFASEAELAERFRDEDTDVDTVHKQDETVVAHASELNRLHGPWLYKLPAYKSDQFTKRMEDLLNPSS